MATGLEIAACDVTSTAQVESDPAVSPWRSERDRRKHLDIAINICKYPSHPRVPVHRWGTPSSPRAQQKCPGPLAGTKGGRIPPPHACPLRIARVGVRSRGVRPFSPCQQPHIWVQGLRSSPVPSDAPVARVAPLIHLTAAVLHVRGERLLNSSAWTPFWRWIKDLVGLVLVYFFL